MDGWGSGLGRAGRGWGGREDTEGTERRQPVRVSRPVHMLRWARARPLARQLVASAVFWRGGSALEHGGRSIGKVANKTVTPFDLDGHNPLLHLDGVVVRGTPINAGYGREVVVG
jgi:hypothetical protein